MDDANKKTPDPAGTTLHEKDIVSRPLLARRSLLAVLTGGVAAGLGAAIAGCATPAVSDRDPGDRSGQGKAGRTDKDPGDSAGRGRGAQPPGLYGTVGFGGPFTLKVGLPADLVSRSRCVQPGGNVIGSTVANTRLETGALPPGLRLDGARIVGVPERAGTWYFRVRFSGISCAGMNYDDQFENVQIITEGSAAPRAIR